MCDIRSFYSRMNSRVYCSSIISILTYFLELEEKSNYAHSKHGWFKLAFEPNGRTRTKFLSKSGRSLNL